MTPRYLIQVHGEWSGIPEYEWMDIDFELETWAEVEKIVKEEIPNNVPYIIYDGDTLIEESIKYER